MRLLTGTLIGLIPLAFASAASAQWKQAQPAQLGYSAAFPEKPRVVSKIDNGVKLNIHAGNTTGLLCQVVVSDYPEKLDPNVELALSRADFAQGVKGRVLTHKRTSLSRGAQQLPAMEYDVESEAFRFRVLTVVDGARVYQVSGGVPAHGGRKSQLERCVRGFRLTTN